MSYKLEFRMGAKSGYHTPAEAKAYYGRYSRTGVTWHWWDSPDKVKDSDHDNIVNYILGKMQRGQGSVNYVLSNKKITILVNPDNVAWASQGGNPTTISVELSPHLNAEGYKKAGWLFNELEGRYSKTLKNYKHSDWFGTQCPGTISISRIKTEAKKWKDGYYDEKPVQPKPTPVPPTVPNISFHLWKEGEVEYTLNKQPTYLYDIDTKSWDKIEKIKSYDKGLIDGKPLVIVGHVHNKALNRDYYITRHSFDKKSATGFHPKDLEIYVPPRPVPKPPEPPKDPVEPTDPPVEKDEIPNWFMNFIKSIIEFLTKWRKDNE